MSRDPGELHQPIAVGDAEQRGVDFAALQTKEKVVAQAFDAVDL